MYHAKTQILKKRKKNDNDTKVKKHFDYDIFNKNNNRLKNKINLKKNNSMSN